MEIWNFLVQEHHSEFSPLFSPSSTNAGTTFSETQNEISELSTFSRTSVHRISQSLQVEHDVIQRLVRRAFLIRRKQTNLFEPSGSKEGYGTVFISSSIKCLARIKIETDDHWVLSIYEGISTRIVLSGTTMMMK